MPHLSSVRRSLAAIACAALVASAARPSGAAAPALSQGLDLSNVDATCAPCADFYRFADGRYAATHPIPADRSRFGSFDALADRRLDVLHGILDDDAAHAAADRSSTAGRLGTYYASCLDTAGRDAAGLAPLQPLLTEIGHVADVPSLARAIGDLRRAGVPVVFAFGPAPDAKHSEETIADLSFARLGLPEREYYFRDDAKSATQRADYAKYVSALLALAASAPAAGDDSAASATAPAGDLLALETALAKVTPTRAERRDPNAAYHPMSVADLSSAAPGLDWTALFTAMGAPSIESLNVERPAYVAAATRLLATTPIGTWRTYLRFRLLNAYAAQLPATYDDLSFAFFGTELTGAPQQRPRWQRCAIATENDLQDLVSVEFAAKAFTPAAKARAVALVTSVHAALRDDLATLDWMTPQTRARAAAKLDAISKKIGYPDRPQLMTDLTLAPGPIASEVLARDEAATALEMARIGEPTDRTRWGMSAPIVNAYYNPPNNEIVFPAGILGEPFFDPDADDAVNYGGIGVVMGHETTHGFDDQGRQYDERGDLEDWWQPADAIAFKSRAACIVDQFSSYTIAGTTLNGSAVQGEAIADLGGATIAFRAFEKTPEAKAGKKIGGYTPEQRFFLSFAQVWASSEREEGERQQALTDPHPASMWRVVGTLSNMPEFQAAFHCKAVDAMVRKNRCRIW